MQIDEGGLTLPARDFYLNVTANQKLLDTYLDYMTTVSLYVVQTCFVDHGSLSLVYNTRDQLS